MARSEAYTLRSSSAEREPRMEIQKSGPAPEPGESRSRNKPAEGSAEKGLMVAVKFWEPRRLLYNLLLFGVVMIWLVKTWPHFRPAMTWEALGIMTVLALLANVCYCAAYLAEILIQNAATSASWNRQRWVIWVVGTLFAIFFE